MTSRTKLIAGAVAAVGVMGAAAGALAASGATDGNEVDTPISGDALDQATAVALAHTGEGTVTETEVGDEDSYYEVEVTLDDGTQVDVQLDEAFNVVSSEADQEEAGDRD